MHNTIRITLLMLFLPVMASAQFYTITKGKDIIPIPDDKSLLYIDNKVKTDIDSIKTANTDTIEAKSKKHRYNSPSAQKCNDSTSAKSISQRAVQTFQNWQYITSMKKSGGTASYIRKWYWRKPFWKQVGSAHHYAGNGTTFSGWPIPTRENTMSSAIGRKASVPIIRRCSTSIKVVITCFGWGTSAMRKIRDMSGLLLAY